MRIKLSGIANANVNEYKMNVDPSLSISSSSVVLLPCPPLEGQIMLQVFLPLKSSTTIMLAYKMIGVIRIADKHHAISDTILDTNVVRKRGELIG